MAVRPAISSVLVVAGASTTQTLSFENQTSRSLVVVLSTTTASVGNTVQVTVNGVTASGYVYPIIASTAIAAVATTVLRIGPGLTPTANLTVNDVVPETVQVVVTVVGVVAFGIDYISSP